MASMVMEREETKRKIRESLFAVLERDGLQMEAEAGGRRWRALCPFHSERTPSFKAWRDGNWYCFGCGEGGDAADYVARRYGLDRRGDFREILGIIGIEARTSTRLPNPKQPPQPDLLPPALEPRHLEAVYKYCRPDGSASYQVRRYQPKTFSQWHIGADGNWRPGLDGAEPLLYRLPQLVASSPQTPVVLLEGEKDVDLAWSLGLTATCNSGGAGNWPHEQNNHLRDRRVLIVPDNDKRGREHAQDVASGLYGIANSIRIVQLADLPDNGDFSDWIAAGHTVLEFELLCAAAPEWEPPQQVDAPTPDPDLSWLMDLDGLKPEPVRWLWPGYIPLHELTILDGDPGLGKSAITLDLAARMSSGAAMPDGSRGDVEGAGGVLLLTCENDITRTVVPRLLAAGADMRRVKAVQWVPNGSDRRMPTILDAEYIALAVRKIGARLVVIDPLMAYMPDEVNSFRDQDVRRVLAPLSTMAQELGIAVVVVRHLNKASGNNPLYRGGGSIGIIGAARVGLLVAPDPADEERRILAQTKNNLARIAPALAFHLYEEQAGCVRVGWDGAVHYSARSLLSDTEREPKGEDETVLGRTKRWLQAMLIFEGPLTSAEIVAAARAQGISEITLTRAKGELRIRSVKGKGEDHGKSFWHLPDAEE